MEEIYKSGKAKAIGLSNWSIPYLEHLAKTWEVVPAVNQVCEMQFPLPMLDLTANRWSCTLITHSTNSKSGVMTKASCFRRTAL